MRFSLIPLLAFLVIVSFLGYFFLPEILEGKKNMSLRSITESRMRLMPRFRVQALAEESASNMAIMSDAVLSSQNSPVVVNFFASWCQPCLAEHPLLVELSDNRQVSVFGIAWRDSSDKAQAWLRQHGNPFLLVGIDSDSKAGIEWGIAGVPETFFLDRSGTIRFVHTGPLTRESLNKGLEAIKVNPNP